MIRSSFSGEFELMISKGNPVLRRNARCGFSWKWVALRMRDPRFSRLQVFVSFLRHI